MCVCAHTPTIIIKAPSSGGGRIPVVFRITVSTHLSVVRTELVMLPVLQYDSAEWEPALFLRQAREFLFFPLLPREASKRVPIFDRRTGSKAERLRSGSLQADLSLIV